MDVIILIILSKSDFFFAIITVITNLCTHTFLESY